MWRQLELETIVKRRGGASDGVTLRRFDLVHAETVIELVIRGEHHVIVIIFVAIQSVDDFFAPLLRSLIRVIYGVFVGIGLILLLHLSLILPLLL